MYRNVIRLCDEGYADGTVVKEGEMPEKTVYTITDKGRARFADLMDEAAALPARVDFGFLPVLANIGLVDEDTGRALIDGLIETHRSTAEHVDGLIPSYERLEARATMELCADTYRLVADHLALCPRNAVPSRAISDDPPASPTNRFDNRFLFNQ